jgi:Zn-dependent peptidase ImmA (M78 family)
LIREAEQRLRLLDLIRPEYLADPENARAVAEERGVLLEALARRRAKLEALQARRARRTPSARRTL